MTIRIPRGLLLAVAALLLAGGAAFGVLTIFGGSSDAAESDVATAEDQEAEKLEAAQQRAAKCEGQLGDFVDALAELDSRLVVGLSMDAYSRQVGNVQVVYDQIPFGQLDAECLSTVGISSEKALNAYATAQNVWADCFEELSCDIDSVDPQLQEQWSKATALIANAERALRSMGRA